MIDKLQALRIEPCSNAFAVDFELRGVSQPGAAQRFLERSQSGKPLVSCLMVTRGEVAILPYSLECYARQAWANRELVIVTEQARVAGIEALVRARGIDNVSLIGLGSGLTLGDLRNIAVARARGDILVQWDDDDLYDPQRIGTAVAVLLQTEVAAAFLDRWVVWWPKRQLAAISERRICEGSMAVWRECVRVYPALARGEDTMMLHALDQPIAVINSPLQYVYAITGRNTWNAEHFEAHLAAATCVFEGADYRALLELLAQRLPIAEYEAALMQL